MKKLFFWSVLLVFPLVTLAVGGVDGLLANVRRWVDLIIPLVAAIALIVFMWGIVKYVASAGDAKKAAEGKSIMIYGVVALFVLFSVWGLVRFLQSSFLIGGNAAMPPPKVGL